jgi:hypothetical protein
VNKKKYCVYDNPATMCREAWVDGRKIAFIIAELLIPKEGFFEAANDYVLREYGAWETGKISGDKDALWA